MNRYLSMLLVSGSLALLTTACSTPQPKIMTLDDSLPKIEVVVTADQKMTYEGKTYTIQEIPEFLKQKKAAQLILMVVAPESKMKKDTFLALIEILKTSGYEVTVAPESKYASAVTQK